MNLHTYQTELQSLATFFSKVKLTGEPIRISPQETIANPMLFVNGHFEYLTNATPLQIERDTFLPYLDRLQEFKRHLEGLA